jgi:hypothetical protein
MSYATIQDVLFALELTDSDLRDRPRLRLDAPGAEPELPEDRGELRRAGRPKAVVELRRAA